MLLWHMCHIQICKEVLWTRLQTQQETDRFGISVQFQWMFRKSPKTLTMLFKKVVSFSSMLGELVLLPLSCLLSLFPVHVYLSLPMFNILHLPELPLITYYMPDNMFFLVCLFLCHHLFCQLSVCWFPSMTYHPVKLLHQFYYCTSFTTFVSVCFHFILGTQGDHRSVVWKMHLEVAFRKETLCHSLSTRQD